MKKLIFFLVAFSISSTCIAKSFTFIFTEGKDARWSQLSNWSNNEYPQNLNAGDTINIFAPDNTKGWVCRVDTNFTAPTGGYFVGPNVQLLLEKNIEFNLYSHDYSNSGYIVVAAGAEFIIDGILRLSFGSFQSDGPVTINGGLVLDEGGNLHRYSALSVNALLKINGSLNSIASQVHANEVWVTSSGGILLQQGWDLESSFEAGHLIQEGNIATSGSGNRISVDGMLNKGEMYLSLRAHFNVNNYLENTGTFLLTGELNLSGSFVNTGFFYAVGVPHQYSNADYCTINGIIVNHGVLDLSYKNFSMNGHLVNDSIFGIQNDDYVINNQAITCNMSGINNGLFHSRASLQMNQPFINLDRMILYTTIDSTRINSPFINEGSITCYGPIALGEAFINKGELKLEPLEEAPPPLMEAIIKQKVK